mmetsp:Transcript_77930/g.233601  ORF Transcript_77930/g.233601 Transcript_77930/m.233601 type:complete len:227 (+) Transcript_77930:376-1056(+)
MLWRACAGHPRGRGAVLGIGNKRCSTLRRRSRRWASSSTSATRAATGCMRCSRTSPSSRRSMSSSRSSWRAQPRPCRGWCSGCCRSCTSSLSCTPTWSTLRRTSPTLSRCASRRTWTWCSARWSCDSASASSNSSCSCARSTGRATRRPTYGARRTGFLVRSGRWRSLCHRRCTASRLTIKMRRRRRRRSRRARRADRVARAGLRAIPPICTRTQRVWLSGRSCST